MTQPLDASRHGDYEQIGDGPGVRLVVPKDCDLGHPIVNIGWYPCPRGCGERTNVFGCKDTRCTGSKTSLAHERDCPRQD